MKTVQSKQANRKTRQAVTELPLSLTIPQHLAKRVHAGLPQQVIFEDPNGLAGFALEVGIESLERIGFQIGKAIVDAGRTVHGKQSIESGLRAGELQEITIALRAEVVEKMQQAGSIFNKSTAEFISEVVSSYTSEITIQGIGGVELVARSFPTREDAMLAAERTNQFDRANTDWTFHECPEGWFAAEPE